MKILISLAPVILNTFLLYLFLILCLSLVSPRQLSQVSIGELLVVALLGSSVETGLIAGNKSLLAGLVSMTTLLVTNKLLSWVLKRSAWLRRILLGKPIPLFFNGNPISANLKKAGLTEDDLMQGIRLRGYEHLDQVKLIMLEIDGTMSVIPINYQQKKKQRGG
jgi:uncharacterized membrane protein YcaP (DUF421 family)